jgi:SAM-dependent methyltransferase
VSATWWQIAAVTTPDSASFDAWYRAIGESARWDPFMRKWLALPAELQSSGYLTGPGLVEVSARLDLAPGSTLVELGCGRGGYGMGIARASGAALVGVDFSRAALTEARRQASRLDLDDRVRFELGDLTSTGLAGGLADAVLCVDAFHFARSTAAAAAGCRQLLRPGGRMVVTSWRPVTPGDPVLPERLRHLDVGADLLAAGFVDLQEEIRPDWSAVELALWEAAVELHPEGDPAIAALVEEARELLLLGGSLLRVLVTARTPVTVEG